MTGRNEQDMFILKANVRHLAIHHYPANLNRALDMTQQLP
jgi:hypothetical protein